MSRKWKGVVMVGGMSCVRCGHLEREARTHNIPKVCTNCRTIDRLSDQIERERISYHKDVRRTDEYIAKQEKNRQELIEVNRKLVSALVFADQMAVKEHQQIVELEKQVQQLTPNKTERFLDPPIPTTRKDDD